LFQNHGISQECNPSDFDKEEIPIDKTKEDKPEEDRTKEASIFDGSIGTSNGATF
jgi:hypothetical protein